MKPRNPLVTAMALYARYKISPAFHEDLIDYAANGKVRSTPTCFAMAKAIQMADGRMTWFIRCAVGPLPELLALLPWPMPFIAFCRRGQSRLRVYPLAALTRKANHYAHQ